MPYTELDKTWRFTSTGTSSTHVDGATTHEWCFSLVTAVGTTATIEVMAFADTRSTSVGVVLGSSQVMASSAGALVVMNLTGPLGAAAPRVASMTSTGVVLVRAVGL